MDRFNAAIAGAVSSFGEFLSQALGAVADPKKFKTKSEQRQAGACPGCGGSGKCFGCEGSGRAAMA
jgi:hypothetical protein